jgi:FkbM family methyltransferase
MTVSRPLSFILAASEQGTLIVNRHDQHVNSSGGYGVGFEILENGAYNQSEVDLVLRLLNWRREFHGDGVLALDCGANIGVHTIAWAKHMTGWGSVLAFEAQERVFYALAGNICLNNCLNARALQVAVGDQDGTLSIPVPDYNRPGSFGSLELVFNDNTENIGQPIDYRQEALQPVPARRLDDLRPPRVDLLKIDVEGMEMSVLRGAMDIVGRCQPYMLIEHIKTDRLPHMDGWHQHPRTSKGRSMCVADRRAVSAAVGGIIDRLPYQPVAHPIAARARASIVSTTGTRRASAGPA